MAELSGRKVLLIIASKDFREEEYFEPKRILESAGADVVTASSKLGDIKGMFGRKVKSEILVDDVKVEDYDAIVLCGGIGASEYYQNKKVHNIFREAEKMNKIIAAICISPVTLANAGLLKNKKATVFYSEKPTLVSQGAEYVDVPVVRDGNVITGRDPTAAVEFGETLKRALLER